MSPSTRTRLGEAVIDSVTLRAVPTTLYPSFSKVSTKPPPIPPDAPVTIAVFFSDIFRTSLCGVTTVLGVIGRESSGPIPQFHRPPYPKQNGHRLRCALQRRV